jgi:hypothetical protein
MLCLVLCIVHPQLDTSPLSAPPFSMTPPRCRPRRPRRPSQLTFHQRLLTTPYTHLTPEDARSFALTSECAPICDLQQMFT